MRRLLLLLFIAAPAFGQPWLDAYNRGVAAVRAKNYAAGAQALEAAIRVQPTESGKLRAAHEFITYLPHMWLGIARVGLNEPDAALAEFRLSEEQGVVQTTAFYAQMREWMAQAQAQKKHAAENAAAGSRREANTAIGRAVGAQSEALTAGADRSETYRAAQAKLQEALDAFKRAGTDIRAYNRAGEIAAQARELFAAAAAEARKKKAAPPPPKQQPKDVVVPFDESPPPPKKIVITNTTVTPPVPAPVPQPVPQPQPPVESAALAEARVAVQNYKRKLIEAKQPVIDATHFERELAGTPDEKTIARVAGQVAEHERRLDEKLKPKPPEPSTVQMPTPADNRPELVAAYRAFAGGDLATSESLLTSAIAKFPSGEAYMLRGCTRYTRAMLSRTPDVLLPAAADDFRAAMRMKAVLSLSGDAFSPKLVAFFESVRKGM
ncbi:MAG TPA: hypothetical protein VG323_19690 [Thermoanaerobaculia bacterium]|nr:hypothetical protein [Thermoanaerobaculia bacterium]